MLIVAGCLVLHDFTHIPQFFTSPHHFYPQPLQGWLQVTYPLSGPNSYLDFVDHCEFFSIRLSRFDNLIRVYT